VEGHRENTLESHLAAVEAGAPWVEVDARITADDVLVARHDPQLEDGRFVSELRAKETGLMRIDDLFEALPDHVGVDVEIKTSLEDALRPRKRTTAALVADVVAREAERRPLLASSFDPSALPIVAERAPDVPLGLITWTRFPMRKAIPAAVHMGAQVVAAHFGSFALSGADAAVTAAERPPAEVVAVAHKAGLEVAAWCPKPPEADELAAAGVDCLVVDGVAAALVRRETAAR
jgi:glycerophosphoryl diester phosphodiesterase